MLTKDQIQALGLDEKAFKQLMTTMAVAGGVALLDMRMPQWHWKVDLPTVDRENARQSILSDLFGTYQKALEKLNLTSELNEALGFASSSLTPLPLLNDEWLRVVIERQGDGAPSRVYPLSKRRMHREIKADAERQHKVRKFF